MAIMKKVMVIRVVEVDAVRVVVFIIMLVVNQFLRSHKKKKKTKLKKEETKNNTQASLDSPSTCSVGHMLRTDMFCAAGCETHFFL
jgi:hypothetical protein